MEFGWSDAQSALHRRIVEQTRDRLMPLVSARSRECPYTRQEWEVCGALGVLGLSAPSRYGGMALDCASTAHALEALGLACEDMGLVFAVSAHLCACVMPIAEFGDGPLSERLLPGLCSGASVGANATTETEAGSDVFSMGATAVQDGADYVLNGEKSFVTNGPLADVLVIYAVTNANAGFLGLSAFAVERDTPGLSTEDRDKMGLESVPVGLVRLDDCRVPAANLLGQEGQGSLVFNRAMQWERTCLFSGYLGMMGRQLEAATDFARRRRQFGKPIGRNQAISHRIVDMKLRLESARLLLARACWRLDQGQDAAMDVSLAKLAVSEAAVQSSLDTLHIMGGAGFWRSAAVAWDLWDAMASPVVSGSSEMQREIIASKLGL
jgi:L-prolyl-PCP dehydrogenase